MTQKSNIEQCKECGVERKDIKQWWSKGLCPKCYKIKYSPKYYKNNKERITLKGKQQRRNNGILSLSEAMKLNWQNSEYKEKQHQSRLIAQNRPERKLKNRMAKIKQIEENHGICYPSYNKTACEYFKKFDEEHNTKGRYAIYGGGEYKIKELGYFIDYINFDLKLIIEWDERRHHYIGGKLREKDIMRQQKIQKFYPDFEFKRIKEEDNNGKGTDIKDAK